MGINLGSNFTLGAGLPLDDRLTVADVTARDAIVARYEGMTVYVTADQKFYSLKGGTTNLDWSETGGSSSSSTSAYVTSGYSATLNKSVNYTVVKQALDDLLNLQYLSPLVSLSVSGSGTVREKGNAVTAATFTATTTKRSDDIASVEYFVGGVSYATEAAPIVGGGVETQAWTGSIADTTVFRVDVTDVGVSGGPSTVSASKTFNYVYPYYYGVGVTGLTPTQVAALTKDIRTENANYNRTYGSTSAQVYYFAYPAVYGNLTSILDENGFETFVDWTKTVANITGLDGLAVSYNIYEFNNVVSNPATNYIFKQ